MTTQRGTYALVLANRKTGCVRIGKHGALALQPGYYVYVGSALGPGGLAARIQHHRQIADRPHWHIDYLRAACDLVEVWFTTAIGRHEHGWAKAVVRMPGVAVPMPGFGSSDCACPTHLFWFQHRPSIHRFRRVTKAVVNVHL